MVPCVTYQRTNCDSWALHIYNEQAKAPSLLGDIEVRSGSKPAPSCPVSTGSPDLLPVDNVLIPLPCCPTLDIGRIRASIRLTISGAPNAVWLPRGNWWDVFFLLLLAANHHERRPYPVDSATSHADAWYKIGRASCRERV